MSAERARGALRAVRREPLLLDDRVVEERLHATALAPDAARWTRAWLVCWFGALAAHERFLRDDPWDIPLRLDLVTVPKGGGDVARQREALDAIAAAGLATIEDEMHGRRARPVARLDRDAFVEHAAALSVDWTAVVAGCGAEPAALLVMRTLAELIVPLDALESFVAVPRRDIIARTGYQQKQVRVALRRLVAADLLEAEGDVGTTARYRLAPRALGRGWAMPAPTPEPTRVAAPAPVVAPPAPSAPNAPNAPNAPSGPSVARAGDGVRLLVGGATVTIAAGAAFEIGPGVAARLEIGPDGRPRLVVGDTPQ